MINEKTKEAFKCLLAKNKVSWLFGGIVALIIVIFIILFVYDLWSWLESLINIVTLGVATIVFYVQTMENWENDLPKRLTVYFKYDNETVMKCEDAFLPGLTNIRALGQQIGLQMSGGRLNFSPADIELIKLEPKKAGVNSDGSDSIYVLPYEAKFNLTARPEQLQGIKCRIWKPPYLKENSEPNFIDEPSESLTD